MARGSIVKRDSGNYAIVYYVDGKQKWKTIGPNKKEAERALTQLMGSVHRGEYQAPKDILFRDLASKWLKKCDANVKPRTLQSYSEQIERRLNPRFGHLQVRSISTEAIELFISDLTGDSATISPTTVGHTLTALKSIFKTGVTWDYLSKNPAINVKKPRTTKQEMDFLKPGEIKELLDAADERHYPLLLTACLTGMRRGELLGLKWEDIDFSSSTITIRRSASGTKLVETKTSTSRRRIVMAPILVDKLKECQTKQIVDGPDNPLGLVFPSLAGTPIDGGHCLKRIFWPTLSRAGLRRVRFHDLRHSFAASLISNNAPLKFVQAQLGHSSIQVTADVYGHLLPESEALAVSALQASIFGTESLQKESTLAIH